MSTIYTHDLKPGDRVKIHGAVHSGRTGVVIRARPWTPEDTFCIYITLDLDHIRTWEDPTDRADWPMSPRELERVDTPTDTTGGGATDQ